ncbi:hypothetical protein SteCoe_27155 [Stentor coeruleus]|uniref:Palmitoyltransferase n=1 Tax=Stentor coeruleus TaxID=5963 RepID=A0A1R2BB58_9CILI|nr:hypothetical protein SteCoe_27155 [Stentor coeruleus]
MPRTTPLTCNKILGNFFVMFVLSVILFIYSNVMKVYFPRVDELGVKVFLGCFHFSVFMLIWCFLRAMLTDPGIVPPLWGFYMGDSENKRRRYCLMCHVFKPERCHHCSACNRCVLNMDHHCPWINNCVGFYNRKFFMLLLVYVLISLYMALISMTFPVFIKAKYLVSIHSIPSYHDIYMLSAYSLNLLLVMTISLFFKFHVNLVLSNSTTIDNMDKKNTQKTNIYDKGSKLNWYQVFGKNKLLWLLPITGISGKPIGDGVIWTQENNNMDEEVPGNEVEVRKSVPGSSEASKINSSPQIGASSIERSQATEIKKKEDIDTKPSTDSYRKVNNNYQSLK